MLAFTSVYFFESGLFNGLQPIQIKNLLAQTLVSHVVAGNRSCAFLRRVHSATVSLYHGFLILPMSDLKFPCDQPIHEALQRRRFVGVEGDKSDISRPLDLDCRKRRQKSRPATTSVCRIGKGPIPMPRPSTTDCSVTKKWSKTRRRCSGRCGSPAHFQPVGDPR